jgi:hypothetical protein
MHSEEPSSECSWRRRLSHELHVALPISQIGAHLSSLWRQVSSFLSKIAVMMACFQPKEVGLRHPRGSRQYLCASCLRALISLQSSK